MEISTPFSQQKSLMPEYQIFISFRGSDTRTSFTGYLYQALTDGGFKTFIDDEELLTGDNISHYIFNAIEGSRLSIVVLSESYADSSWCLDELIKILECMERNDQMVLPIFYQVEPSHVRNQKNSYATAFAKHERRFGEDSLEVNRWRSALHHVCQLSGLHYNGRGYEYQFIKEIVKRVNDVRDTPTPSESSGQHSTIGAPSLQSFPSGNEYYFNSTIEASEKLLKALQDDSCYVIGLCGRKGSGKTALVKAEISGYKQIFDRVIFPNMSKDQDIKSIQEGIANSLNVYFEKNDRHGVRTVKVNSEIEKMDGTTLIILDDFPIDYTPHELGIPYNSKRCRVLLTTRDESDCTLMGCNHSILLNPLSNDEAWVLLQHLSGVNSNPGLLDVAQKIAFKCNGLPGLIKDVAASLKRKSIDKWNETLISLSHSTARYQIFISFRGETRHVFTKHLYDALCQEGFKTFMDDKSLEGGVPIEKLLDDIEESRFSIVILSKNYADSEWCLRELVQILACNENEEKKQLVFPIFYDVEPGDVRHVQNSYGEAMGKHEKEFEEHPEITQKWKNALRDICKLTGFRKPEDWTRDQLIERIVRFSCESRHRLHIQSLYMN